MESGALAAILILQVVSGVHSSIQGGPPLDKGNNGHDLPEVPRKTNLLMLEWKPVSQAASSEKDNSLDRVNESQRMASPTLKDKPAKTNIENEIINNAVQSTTEDSTTTDSKVLSGAGHLETNEILKDRNPLPKKASSSDSNDSGHSNTVENKKGLELVLYHPPDPNKSVENAVNNLPSTDKLHRIPQTKNEQEPNNKNLGLEDITEKIVSQKNIVVKLQKDVQIKKELEVTQTQSQGVNVQKQANEGILAQVQNQDENNKENQPCDCEGECDEEMPQYNTKPEEITSSYQENPKGNEDQQTNNDQNKKLLAHVIVKLRIPKSEKTPNTRSRSWTPSTSFSEDPDQPLRPLENPTPMLSRVTATKSIFGNIIPLSPSGDKEGINSGMANGGCGEKGDENENSQENNRSSYSRFVSDEDVDESSQESQSSYTRYAYPDKETQNYLFPDISGGQHRPTVQKEFIFLRYLNNIIKEIAAADALREKQARHLPQYDPSHYYAESSDPTSAPNLSFVLTVPNHPTSEPRLPPLYFPQDNSGYKIKQLYDPEAFLNKRKAMPKEFILMRYITDTIKEKAAADALKGRKERRPPQFDHASSYAESSKSLSSPISNFIIVRTNSLPPKPQLPPFYFPQDNSGYKIKQLYDQEAFLDKRKAMPKEFIFLRHMTDSIKEKAAADALKERQENKSPQDDLSSSDADLRIQPPTNHSSQDIPWCIRNILANLRRSAEEGGRQPIPTQPAPLQKPAEEKDPALFRAFLAPYAL